jgi:RecB family exonuclease
MGTATALLVMRDELVLAGWNGEKIPGGSERLDTFAELEVGPALPLGTADRISRLEDELRRVRIRPVDELRLAEPAAVWPARWRRLFATLAELGVPVRTVGVTFPADGDSDLARVQAVLRGETAHGSPALTGDGSLIVLRAETPAELGPALAALLRKWDEPSVAIIRGGEVRTLDDALAAQGVASLGAIGTSTWRPAAQVLPLAVELAFEPRDPCRVLEMLTVPMGPFAGSVGRELAAALSEAPGIGGPRWQKAKQTIAEFSKADAEARLARIAEWLETPGHVSMAPRAAMQAVADRVRAWLQARLAYERGGAASPSRVEVLGAAFAQAQAFEEALIHDPREMLDLVAARLLVEQVSNGLGLELSAEHAGRMDPVDHPAGLRVARDLVVWWHCVSGTEWRPSVVPWRRTEIAALNAAGVVLANPADRLAEEARTWRQAVLAARKRLVIAIPRWAAGKPLDAHPIWDEIVARLGAGDRDIARITVEARALAQGRAVDTVDLGRLQLPAARAEWRIERASLSAARRHSASSLDALLGCPLRWVLTYPAGLREGQIASIGDGPLLSGTLGHRLVETLHQAGALREPAGLAPHLDAHFERLLREEASVLLRPGMTFELAQLRRQLTDSVTALAEMISASKLTVVDVESRVVVSWRDGELEGRLDLLLQDAKGSEVVLDLKWGRKRYRDLLLAGQAVQLAVYAAARRIATNATSMPPAAYFCLSRGDVLAVECGSFVGARAIDGPALEETWAKLEKTVERVEATLAMGRIPVTGLRNSRPLLESLLVPESDRTGYLDPDPGAACEYCPHGAICGRSWEALA